jgi:hypothetical protein
MIYRDEAGRDWELTEKGRWRGSAVVKVRRVGVTQAEWLAAPMDWECNPAAVVATARYGKLTLVED